MVRKIKNVLLMMTNVGSTSLEQNSFEEEPFLDKAKCAMKLLVEKKIFLQPKDEIGIITMGDEITKNPEDMYHVRNYNDHLLIPNWEMVKYINNLEASRHPCNWIEAFHVALNFIQREVIDPAFRIFVVTFNNFKETEDSLSNYDPNMIIDDVKKCGELHLLFVGENPLNDKSWRKAHASYSEKFAFKIMKECSGQYEQINSFIDERRFYNSPSVTPSAWKFNLEIDELHIPCSAYVKINEDVKIESWKMKAINDNDEDVLNRKPGEIPRFIPHENNASKIVKEKVKLDLLMNELTADEIINGYKFGNQYIPVSAEDEQSMKYEGGPKGMTVYGFVPQSEIKLEYWCGKGSRIIVPQTKDNAPAFYSLVQAMVENEYVAIIRKIHAYNHLPKMGVLFPKVEDGEIWCLVHLELPYNDEVRFLEKKPIKSPNKNVTKEHVEAMDNWIDAMTVSHEDLIYMNPGCFPNIPHQYYWNAMADRALNPDNPLVSLPSYLSRYLVPPNELRTKAKHHLEKLNQLFGWHNEPVVKKKRTTNNIDNVEVNVVQTEKDTNFEVIVDETREDKNVEMNVTETDKDKIVEVNVAGIEKDKNVPASVIITEEKLFIPEPEHIELDLAELDDM